MNLIGISILFLWLEYCSSLSKQKKTKNKKNNDDDQNQFYLYTYMNFQKCNLWEWAKLGVKSDMDEPTPAWLLR